MNPRPSDTFLGAITGKDEFGPAASAVSFDAELAKAGANVKSRWGMALFLARRYPLGGVGLAIVVIFILVAVLAPYITSHDPLATNPAISLAAPSAAHPMGADFMGRDLFSRVVYGARTSLAVAFGATTLGVFFGVLIGLASGYLGGWVDLTTQRIIDMLQALPTLILAMAMAAALGPSLTNTIIAIAIPKLPSIARVIRASTLSLREMPFVEAARAMGMSEMRIAHAPYSAQHACAADRAGDGRAGQRDSGRGLAFVPRAGRSGAVSFLGAHAFGVSGRVCAHRTVAGHLPGSCDHVRGFRHQPAGDALRDLLDPRQRTSN